VRYERGGESFRPILAPIPIGGSFLFFLREKSEPIFFLAYGPAPAKLKRNAFQVLMTSSPPRKSLFLPQRKRAPSPFEMYFFLTNRSTLPTSFQYITKQKSLPPFPFFFFFFFFSIRVDVPPGGPPLPLEAQLRSTR